MFLQFLSAVSKLIAPSLADHLWQSTLFAAAAALLTLALRGNSARLRYAIWLAASLKFLVPFSLLVAAGGLFSWRHAPVSTASTMYVVEVVGQPFAKGLAASATAVGPSATPWTFLHLTLLFLSVWLIGFLGVLCVWIGRWRRVAISLRDSRLLTEGREHSILRRLEPLHSAAAAIKLVQSDASLEPGVFGLFHPVLLWPRAISEHLDDAHLEAVIAHELCHVRRRDNLAAFLHMLVEAGFWFHPLVWWIGTQLIAERERACDEAVIELGGERQAYAESILKVCEFCLSSPLACVSGVTGSDLKKRMVQIMTDHVVQKLNLARRLLLWTATCLAIVLPIAFGMFNVTRSRAESPLGNGAKFASVSIKPHPAENEGFMMQKMLMAPVRDGGGFTARGVSLHSLLGGAYMVQDTQIIGEPDWAKSARYDIDAKADPSLAKQTRNLGDPEDRLRAQQMLQQLLADYFKVSLHQEVQDQPVYELVVAESGPKLQLSPESNRKSMMRVGIGELASEGTPLDLLVGQLSQRMGRTVVDKTGLKGNYVFHLHWTPDTEEQARIRAAAPGLPDAGVEKPGVGGPPLMTALEEQLGLKLQPTTERVPVLIIDHAEQPSQN